MKKVKYSQTNLPFPYELQGDGVLSKPHPHYSRNGSAGIKPKAQNQQGGPGDLGPQKTNQTKKSK